MAESFLIWSCSRRKFLKVISSKGGYKERLGSRLNSVWYINITVYKDYDIKPDSMNLADRSYSTNWEITIQREHGLDSSTCLNAKLVSNTKVLVDKDIYFSNHSLGSGTLRCDTKTMTGYNLDCVLRFPETNSAENIFEEQMLMSKLKYLADDFQAMLDKGRLSDVTLKCGTDVLNAHKFVLCARSPVFEAMFASPMQESKEDTVIVQDIDSGVFRAAINFLYSGQVKITSTAMACDLLYVGEKYQIKELKEGCVNYLKSVVSHENVIEILEVSDLYDSRLKSHALNFAKDNFDDLKNTREWNELKAKNTKLALEVYCVSE